MVRRGAAAECVLGRVERATLELEDGAAVVIEAALTYRHYLRVAPEFEMHQWEPKGQLDRRSW